MLSLKRRITHDQRGISSVIVAVCLFAIFGALMLTLDAGNLWATRRRIITGTDAAALHAAQYFNSGGGNPCSTADIVTAENDAADVMTQNHPQALHNPGDTPDGFEVTLADPTLCGIAAYVPGKVRFDGRLQAQAFFSQIFGFGRTNALSSSTAAWGYITSIGDGLRPIAVCDQSEQYQLYTDLWAGTIDLTTYNGYFGRDEGLTPDQIKFPASSANFIRGDSNHNPNKNKSYVTPDGTDGHRTIHRMTMPDIAACGQSPGNRVWVDFTEEEGGGIGVGGPNMLEDQILYGYKGEVALEPHDCNPGNDNPTPEDCGSAPGNKSALERALGDIVCDVITPAMSCPYIFPILVVDEVTSPGGANAHYVQVAFLFVVLRGFGNINSDLVQFDFEFVEVQTSGQVGAAPPTTDHPYQTGVQLCGADHDKQEDRCPF